MDHTSQSCINETNKWGRNDDLSDKKGEGLSKWITPAPLIFPLIPVCIVETNKCGLNDDLLDEFVRSVSSIFISLSIDHDVVFRYELQYQDQQCIQLVPGHDDLRHFDGSWCQCN